MLEELVIFKQHYGDTQRFAQGDIGMAAMNMCYQALELGLSTCILGVNDQKKIRKPVEEICSFNHW